jgi:hypothetical protein
VTRVGIGRTNPNSIWRNPMLTCPNCGSLFELKRNDLGQYFYGCTKYGCSWYVGCDQETKQPKGVPGNSVIRCLRKECHRKFDFLWQCGYMTRKSAYVWVAHRMGIQGDAHISCFDLKMCCRFLRLVSVIYDTLPKTKIFRKRIWKTRKFRLSVRCSRVESEESQWI